MSLSALKGTVVRDKICGEQNWRAVEAERGHLIFVSFVCNIYLFDQLFGGALNHNLDKMDPINNPPQLMGHDLESSEDEDLHSSFDSISSVDSISSADTISADELAIPSTSMVFPITIDNLPSPVSSARVIDLTSPIPSTASTPPVHPTPHGIQENNDDYRFEAARRWSFRNWPKSFIDPVSLAAAGFYYTGDTDVVRCFECQLVVNLWLKGDIPMQIHEMRSPKCRFIRNEHCDNVAIGVDPDKVLQTKQTNRNISCRYGLQYQESFDFNDHQFLRNLRDPTAYELSRLGLKRVKKPEKMKYASYESRLKSFATWPTNMKQTSEELADAGFYYTRVADLTRCYHCGLNIAGWELFGDPWEEHASLSPKCCYLLAVRGWEYVNKVIGTKIYGTSAEAAIEIADENPERSNSENDTNEMTLIEKIAALEQENRALKDARSCKVCTERKAIITFLPCGHLATCQYCSAAFKKCIICKKNIKAISRTFFA
ncbi:baculoviral IAP repeat-containing protein 7-B-like [Bombus flavifrons]|uniref:baculoviral IAP repeat-containing protein 7-B-like n=1 Tax=Bombus flavifrons TaxID=103934 RepID=UPI00370495CF